MLLRVSRIARSEMWVLSTASVCLDSLNVAQLRSLGYEMMESTSGTFVTERQAVGRNQFLAASVSSAE